MLRMVVRLQSYRHIVMFSLAANEQIRLSSIHTNGYSHRLIVVCCIHARPDDLKRAFSLVAEYLRTDESDVINLMDYGLSLGRRFRSLKLWMVIRAYGRDGLAHIIEGHIKEAQWLAVTD